jgi:hypothetical protein
MNNLIEEEEGFERAQLLINSPDRPKATESYYDYLPEARPILNISANE